MRPPPISARPIRRWATLAAALGAALFSAMANTSQAQGTPAPEPAAPAAAPADVKSMTAVIHAAYDVISGPAGTRDWNRFYSLFAPGARLIRTLHDSTGPAHLQPMTPHEFATAAGEFFSKNPFYESEIGRESNTFGASRRRSARTSRSTRLAIPSRSRAGSTASSYSTMARAGTS